MKNPWVMVMKNDNRIGGEGNRHHLVSIAVEELSSVPRPQRFRAAFARNLLPSFQVGEGAHVDLVSARFIRNIGQPAVVGRQLSRSFIEVRFEKEVWFSFFETKHADIPSPTSFSF